MTSSDNVAVGLPEVSEANGSRADAAMVALPPLAIRALMVTRADLVAALRIYVPHLADIEAIDGERFLLVVGEHADRQGGR